MLKIKKTEDHLYNKYPGQHQPQDTYLELDPADETLRADWNGEIGNAVPFTVWHGTIRRYTLSSPYLKADAINALMDEIAPFAQRVCDGYREEWDGSNHVGCLTADAHEAEEEIYCALDDPYDEDIDCIKVWDTGDYFYPRKDELLQLISEGASDDDLRAVMDEWTDSDYVDIFDGAGVDGYIRDLREEHENSLDDE